MQHEWSKKKIFFVRTLGTQSFCFCSFLWFCGGLGRPMWEQCALDISAATQAPDLAGDAAREGQSSLGQHHEI